MRIFRVVSTPWYPWPFRVGRYRRELKDTFTVFLEPEDGTGEFLFQPGQFNMIYLPGAGEVPISISGDPAKPGNWCILSGPWVTLLIYCKKPGRGILWAYAVPSAPHGR